MYVSTYARTDVRSYLPTCLSTDLPNYHTYIVAHLYTSLLNYFLYIFFQSAPIWYLVYLGVWGEPGRRCDGLRSAAIRRPTPDLPPMPHPHRALNPCENSFVFGKPSQNSSNTPEDALRSSSEASEESKPHEETLQETPRPPWDVLEKVPDPRKPLKRIVSCFWRCVKFL